MRVVRALAPDEPRPIVAIERDGALYDAAELERSLRVRAPWAGSSDFQHRVVALRCAGLDALDERLAAGARPTEARLDEAQLVRLPPCDTDRGAYVWCTTEASAHVNARPARVLACDGLPASVFAPGARAVACTPALGAVLADDLAHVTPEAAAAAIAGVTPVLDWAGGHAAHLGHALVAFPDGAPPAFFEARDVELRARLTLAGREAPFVARAPLARLAAAIARASAELELRAGDVVACALAPSRDLAEGERVELVLERLGRATGAWRAR